MFRGIFFFSLALTSAWSSDINIYLNGEQFSSFTPNSAPQNILLQNENIIQRAHAQYVHLTINYHDRSNANNYLQVQNAVLRFGKWTDSHPHCQETSSPNRLIISKDKPAEFTVCGRQDSPSGSQGSFTLEHNVGGVQRPVYEMSFDVPWSPFVKNTFELKDLQDEDNVSVICKYKPVSGGLDKTIDCYYF